MAMRKFRIILLFTFCFLVISLVGWKVWQATRLPVHFDGSRAYQDVIAQVAFGPRIPDSQAHSKTIAYIQEELRKAGWKNKVQETSWRGYAVLNIIASRDDQTPQIIFGAHYDSRLRADQDLGPGSNSPVPGANDGASGVAVLLELARTIPSTSLPTWLVFFDAEDNGGLDGREWSMGSRAFVAELTTYPRAAIIVDMVGDNFLNIFIERNSTPTLVAEIWGQASTLGYEHQFIQIANHGVIDDHTPFLEAGIPAVDIIDFDYPFWHTAADTPDKVSPKSLEIVGKTLLAWLVAQR
jgi:glutaminyl-peptide cyclotransferase